MCAKIKTDQQSIRYTTRISTQLRHRVKSQTPREHAKREACLASPQVNKTHLFAN